jgi:hypothetical protein
VKRSEVADQGRQAMLWGSNNASKEPRTLGHWLPCGHYVADLEEVVSP